MFYHDTKNAFVETWRSVLHTEIEMEKLRVMSVKKYKFSLTEAFGAVDTNNDTFIDKEDVSNDYCSSPVLAAVLLFEE